MNGNFAKYPNDMSKTDKPTENKPIRTAIVGLGRAGWGLHFSTLKDHADFLIVDVADSDASRCEEASAAVGCRTHGDLDHLLRATDADLVVLATPNLTHESDALKVLESDRHCVVEKPMALSFAGAERMVTASRKAQRKLFVHHSYRFTDEYLHIKEILDSGILGDVFEVRGCWSGFARRNDWQTLQKNGGGLLNNNGPHMIDMTLKLLDAPVTELLSDLRHVKDAGDTDDHVHAFMKGQNGRVADMTLTSCMAFPAAKWMLLGSCGTMVCDGERTVLKYFDPKELKELEVVDAAAPGRAYGNDDILPWKEETREVKPQGKYPGYYENVADVLLRGGEMLIKPEEAAENTRIMEWIRKAGTDRR